MRRLGRQCSCHRTAESPHNIRGWYRLGQNKRKQTEHNEKMVTQLAHGRCGSDSHTPGEVNNSKQTGSNDKGSEDSNNNGNYNNNGGEREDPTVKLPTVTPRKWSDSLACKTVDAQSKVFDTGRKKPGGTRIETLRAKRRELLRHPSGRKGNDNETPGPQQLSPLGSVDLNARTCHRREILAENSRRIREARLERSIDRAEEMDGGQRFHPSAQRARKSF